MRISENQLKRVIRNIILVEGAVTPDQLDSNYTVVIKDSGIVPTPLKNLSRVDMKERFGDLDPNMILNMPSYSIYIKYKYVNPKLSEPAEDLFAELEMRKWVGMCNDAWEVYWAEVHEDYKSGGFGPLMYDVAMELAGKYGLICDRNSVSHEAARVWNHYLENRADVYPEDIDVENCASDMMSKKQLDNILSDEEYEQPWHQRVYFSTYYMSGGKQKPTIDALHRADRLEWVHHIYPGEK